MGAIPSHFYFFMEKFTRKYIISSIYHSPKEVKVIDIFERYNPTHPLVSMLIAKVFYVEMINGIEQGVIEYVDAEDLRITNEESPYKENIYDLMKKYNGEYYIENDIYNFVCYDGIKI